MGKIEKYFYWFCFFLAIYIVIGFKLIPVVLQDQLVKNLDENLTQKTTIKKVDFNPFTLNTKIHGFVLGEPKNPTISFDMFEFDFGLMQSIYELHANVEKVKLSNAFINVIEQKDGTINLTKLLKEQKEKPKEKNKEPSDIKFLVTKLFLENANIKFTKITDSKPYVLNLKNINYNLYDLGTYKNILSSNNFSLVINDSSKVSIQGGFKLEPFTMHGKAKISQLKLEELLAYKKEILNFSMDKKASFDLALDFDMKADKKFDLNIDTNKLLFKNINLTQNKKAILNLDKLEVKKLKLNLDKQTVIVNNTTLVKPEINMVSSKDGINLVNLVKSSKNTKNEKVQKKEESTSSSKPWHIKLSDLKLDNSNFSFNDKVNSSLTKVDNFNIKLPSINIAGSNITIPKIQSTNPSISFTDNKNKTSVLIKKASFNTNTLNIKNSNISINNIAINKGSFDFKDKRNATSIAAKKTSINLNSLKVQGSDVSINKIAIKKANLNFTDRKSALYLSTANPKIDINSLLVKKGAVSINSINLNTSSINLKDRKNALNIKTTRPKVALNKLTVNKGKVALSTANLSTSKIALANSKTATYINLLNSKVKTNNLSINGSKIKIASIKSQNPSISINDRKNKTNIAIKRANLDVKNMNLNKSNIYISSAKVLRPTITLENKKDNTLVKAHNLEVYLNKISQKRGNLGINSIRVFEPKASVYNTKEKTRIFASNLDLSVSKISNTKRGLKVVKTTLSNPKITVILPKKPEQKKKETKKVAKKTTNKKSNSKLDIGPINIKNATLVFEDKNLPIPFKTEVSKLNGDVSEFKTSKNSTSKLDLNGVVDKYGTTHITGLIDPNNIKFLTDIHMVFNNISMKNFTPYTSKFIGKELNSGKLDLDLKYNIQKSDLEAKNNIVITKLKLGKKVQSKDAVSLPLELAIALLEDSNGVIDLNIPVSGNVDDPKFSVGPIVWKAFVNLITKAITAPFSLLGAIFGFDENEIKSVHYKYAQSDVTPIQKETLDKITKILKKRPNLAISLSPTYDKTKDLKALKKAKFDKFVKNELKNFNEEDYLELLEDTYEDFDKKINNLKKKHVSKKVLNKKTYKKELEEFIISKQKITNTNLQNLANKRIKGIKDYLLLTKKINPKQIIISNKTLIKNSSDKNLNIDLKIDKVK